MFEHLMMKHLFLLFFLVVITAASAIADEPNESRLEAEPFVHPGLLHSRAELDFVREKVQAGQEPWKSAWERLRSVSYTHLRAHETVLDLVCRLLLEKKK